MKCRCGGDTFVVDSRASELNTIRRRRQCETCGTRVTTWESTIKPTVVLKHRDTLARRGRRFWNSKTIEERREIKKRERAREAARAEAAETGRPVADIYQEWGCE